MYRFGYTQSCATHSCAGTLVGYDVVVYQYLVHLCMAHDNEGRLRDEETEDLLADPVGEGVEDDDDEKDPLMAGDEEIEEKDWM